MFASYSEGYYITIILSKASIGVLEHYYMLVSYILLYWVNDLYNYYSIWCVTDGSVSV